jgi:hypothetical protein
MIYPFDELLNYVIILVKVSYVRRRETDLNDSFTSGIPEAEASGSRSISNLQEWTLVRCTSYLLDNAGTAYFGDNRRSNGAL